MTQVDPTRSIDEPPTYDAQQVKEAIAEGEEEKPEVNVDADYALAQEFSAPAQETEDMKPIGSLETVADIHAPAQDNSTFESSQGLESSGDEGDPDNFRDMARDLNSRTM